ncbi:uncharacterized protein LOC120356871 isoform X1 [Solenopsis invicta]|uniref:uncharacterized protein LOC120356871 isoform X1 n=1 Tax=Solenopsis invicta TaxID=13686 RepID=UPI00193EAFE0|nr:uncharacterized protein LOC120356871 isoform X1 [Solenopsis invicta]
MENEPGLSNSSSTSSVSIISVDSKKSRISGTGFGRIGRKKDSIRKHFYEITKGTKTILKCQVCENEVSNKACRLRKHFEKCTKKQDAKENICDSTEGSSGSETEDSNNPAINISRKRRNPDVQVQIQQLKQQKLNQFLLKTTETDKQKLDLSLASYFYSSGVPFRHSENFYFKKMISDLRPGYTPPNRKKLAGELLNKIYNKTQEDAKNHLNGKSVTLIQDGWSAIHNEPVIASCVSDGEKSFFLSSYETGSNQKTSKYCLDLAVKDIMEAENRFGCTVKSFVSDNEAKMKKMRSDLQKKLNNESDFYFIINGCAAHFLNLLCGDICKLSNVKTIIKQVVELSKYFRNNHAAKGLLAEFQNFRIPQLPGETRWNSVIECLEVFVINRDFYLKIAENHEESIEKNIIDIIQNIGLMKEVKSLITQLKPIRAALNKLQSENATLSDTLTEFLKLKELSTNDVLLPYNDLIKKRFDDCITPAHIIGFLLNPKNLDLQLDSELEEAGRTWLSEEVSSDFLLLLIKFRLKISPFPNSFFHDQMREQLSSIQWWEALLKTNTVNLKFCEFSLHLQKCVASSASIERIFSNFGIIQTKLRNRLGIEKASKLVASRRMLNMIVSQKEDMDDF